ncbi:hypothetical protein M8C21_024050 [Ambrosia artemisiifolia]|uniref:Uncharacterized protein n=1 Tax=Ambrosia artemisiifolia TaxID=4212 RepID=A0AAD5G8L3_AMBAR|nr:hypothetical protein M8C21_024050 [Ambrosia artemisiifolia]
MLDQLRMKLTTNC